MDGSVHGRLLIETYSMQLHFKRLVFEGLISLWVMRAVCFCNWDAAWIRLWDDRFGMLGCGVSAQVWGAVPSQLL